MWCLTIATNAVVTWTTEYNGLAVTALRRAGRDIDDAVLAHIWPASRSGRVMTAAPRRRRAGARRIFPRSGRAGIRFRRSCGMARSARSGR
jgi:Tn3 transposase DDE domain